MDHQEKLNRLETENERLREELETLRRKEAVRRQARRKTLRMFSRMVAGNSLKNSTSQLIDQFVEKRIERDAIKDFVYALMHRLTRVGLFTIVVATAPLALALIQTWYLKQQNEKLDYQNKRIEQQTYLQEAERRSSLVFLFDNIMDRMDQELRSSPNRSLSPQLVGRIVALSKALKPYRYLDGDTITPSATSPERGQLLFSLQAARLHPGAYDQIYSMADFSYAVLEDVNLDKAYMRGINLSHAQLNRVSLAGANLSYANLSHAVLDHCTAFQTGEKPLVANFNSVNYFKAQLRDCDFSHCSFERANFSEALLDGVVFTHAMFKQTQFKQSVIGKIDFSDATFLGAELLFASGDSSSRINFSRAVADSSSWAQLRPYSHKNQDQSGHLKRRYIVNSDTFFIDDRTPFIVSDSFWVYELQ